MTLEFVKDGTVICDVPEGPLIGKYSYIDDNRIKIEYGGIGAKLGLIIAKVSITGGKLQLTDQQGVLTTFQRAK